LRTWMVLATVDPGYRAGDVLTVRLNLPMPFPGSSPRYRTPDGLRQFYDAVERELDGQPGVRRVAWGNALPLDGWWFAQPFDIAGDEPKPVERKDAASYHMISPAYLATLGIPIVTGRDFTSGDTTGGAPVCIVSEAFVRQHLGGRQPLGTRISVPMMSFGPPANIEREIVGVARQVKGQPDEPKEQPQIYVPLAQNAWWAASLVVQPDGGRAEALVSTVRAAIARVDKERPIGRMRTLEGIAWGATSRPRFRAILVTAFAALALALSMIGVFGVLVYSVQQRTREFGVRIALGASVGDIMRLIMASAAVMTVIGVAVGLVGAGVLSRSMTTLLFGVQPLDPVTFLAAAAVLLVTAAVATAAPALRAARVDPTVTLRNE
jgi:putative ABC transport system permease protein